MSSTITITLTQSAQRGAILAGEDGRALQTYEVDSPLLGRLLTLPWATVSSSGEVSCAVPATIGFEQSDEWEELEAPIHFGATWGYGAWREGAAAVRPADAAAAIAHGEAVMGRFAQYIRGRRAEAAAKSVREAAAQADQEEKERAEVAAEQAAWESYIEGLPPADRASVEGLGLPPGPARLGAARARLADSKRRDEIGDYLADIGCLELAERWADRTAPAEEVRAAIDTHVRLTVLRPLGGADFMPLLDCDCDCDCEEEGDCLCSYSTSSVRTEYPAAVWTVIQNVQGEAKRLGVEDLAIEARLHTALRSCGGTAERWAVHLWIPMHYYPSYRIVRKLGV